MTYTKEQVQEALAWGLREEGGHDIRTITLAAALRDARDRVAKAREEIRDNGEAEIETGGNPGYIRGIDRALNIIDKYFPLPPPPEEV